MAPPVKPPVAPAPSPAAGPTVFPKTARLGRVGTARLVRVERSERGPVGIYAVDPGQHEAYHEAIGALRDQLNLTYQPIPALWGSWRLLESDDEVALQVGLEAAAGKARAEAFRALRPKATSLVSEAEVKALALGYLLRAGAEV